MSGFIEKSRSGWAVGLSLVLLVAACGAPQSNRVELPPPVQSTTLGAGDVFELRIVDEEKLPSTYAISPDGSVDFPFIHRVHIEGLEPQQVVDLVRQRLIDEGYFKDPSVMVIVKEYKSKNINILGQVKNPGSFPIVPGFTLVQAISRAGGLNSIADFDGIVLTRTTGKQRRTIRLSLRSITDGRSSDILLQAGDVITVGERVF
jgi:polysaccharide export outer membrane protein